MLRIMFNFAGWHTANPQDGLGDSDMFHLVLPLDGSELSERSIAHALAIARSVPSKVTLLRIVTPAEFRGEDSFSRVDWRLHKHQARVYLERTSRVFTAAGAHCDIRIEEGRAAESIIDVASEIRSPLLVMSTHGRGAATDFLLGSVASKVLSTTDASVLLVGARDIALFDREARYERILAVIDGSPESECTIRTAAALAGHMNVSLYVVCLAHTMAVPTLLNGDRRAQKMCHDLNLIICNSAQRRLSELQATLPSSLGLHVSVLVTDTGSRPLLEVTRRYNPNLILTGIETWQRGDRLADDVCQTTGSIPLMILSPKGIGAAISEASAQAETTLAHADIC